MKSCKKMHCKSINHNLATPARNIHQNPSSNLLLDLRFIAKKHSKTVTTLHSFNIVYSEFHNDQDPFVNQL